MKKRIRVLGIFLLMAAVLSNLLLVPTTTYAADEYDTLRQKAYDMLTGGQTYDPADPDIAVKITNLTTTAQSYWDTMDRSPGRTYLWSDLATTTKSSDVSGSYQRLEAMTSAYCTRGSSLQNNASLLADIISGMDWMYTNRYNLSVPKRGYDNWFDWQISSPLCINNITTMIYSSLTSTQISNWHAVIDWQALTWGTGLVGANRVWACYIKILSGIVVKSSSKIAEGRDQLSPVFVYVTSGEGMYSDGSFIQHTALIPYNGGYGVNLIDNLTKAMYVIAGSTWAITDTNVNNVYQWIYNAFEPLFYNDSMFDMVRGRNISRYASDNQGLTSMGALGGAVARMASSAPSPTDQAAYKSMVKKWMQQASSPTPYADLSSIDLIVRTKAIMNDGSVTPREDLIMNKQYPNMSKAVHLRPGFAFGVSMFSDKIANYEVVNNENLRGWHTGDGMTYLYNSDLSQYKNSFWPTVNSYRLPGTTVNQNTTTPANAHGTYNWVGGTTIAGQYGLSGMQYNENGYSLNAKKSWFMFDDEIVCLGSGITSTDNKVVETIVENRQLNSNGDNALLVNGIAKSNTLGWNETMTGVTRIHLTGNTPGTDVGYYFPTPVTIKGLREARTDQWSSIDQYYTDPNYYTNFTQNYMNLWFDHGTNPTNGTYSYVLLPNKTSMDVYNYYKNPNITVVENSADAHAVKENTLGILGVNFWNDITKTVDIVTSDKKASVMTKTTGTDVEVSVSDPTMANTGIINLEINKSAACMITADPEVTVLQYSPTIKLAVNVNGAKGKAITAKFSLGTPSNLALNKTVTSSSSLENSNFGKAKAVDGQRSSVTGSMGWTSNNSLTTNHSEWVTVDLGASNNIGRVDLYPRNDGVNTGYGFPIDFTIQVSPDNANWTTVVTKTAYPMPAGTTQSFTFTGVSARYVKINGTNLRSNPNDSNLYRMQFAEMEVCGVNLALNKTVTASSSVENTSFGKAKAVDGQRSSVTGSMGWTSNNSLTTNHSEWVTVDLGASNNISRVDLYPRNDGVNSGYGFPIDFTIEVSPDNVNWTTVATRTAYPLPAGTVQSFIFTGTSARYIKINGTNLKSNPYDSSLYRMQFAEIEAYN